MTSSQPPLSPSYLSRLWFGLELPIGRREYFLSGIFLAGLKYAVDLALVGWLEKRSWSPLDYLNPLGWIAREDFGSSLTLGLMWIWMLPFVWVGLSMTLRRARDAGLPVGIAMLFFIPGLNYFLMASLSLMPTRSDSALARARRAGVIVKGSKLKAIFAGLLTPVPVLLLSIPYGLIGRSGPTA